ncbi:MAG TPA: hypothetical protein DIU35_15930 [Candidatus Latescibacteria bacterium]|nr:hypothetical protein [Candidatus Latescibacterota bacterium]
MCLNNKTVEKVWAHGLWEAFGGKPGYWGYASSPIVYKGILGFDMKTGKVAWFGGEFKGAYSSPKVINVDGQDQRIPFVENLAIGMDPSSGEVL